tara:strand:+ start:490 stop:1086 length:597 start_codon:yes stop_codon:yes gene_type:complete
MNSFEPLFKFEKSIAEFFGARYAVATDCCTHAIEMCLKLKTYDSLNIPAKTYPSIPFMLEKINHPYNFVDKNWRDFYYVAPDIIDAAVFWQRNSYIPRTKMCLSFHFKKHINIGRGGMILLDNEEEKNRLVKMRHDGRSIYDGVLYADEDITEIGYHYYMTPETANIGLEIFNNVKDNLPISRGSADYKDLREYSYFK